MNRFSRRLPRTLMCALGSVVVLAGILFPQAVTAAAAAPATGRAASNVIAGRPITMLSVAEARHRFTPAQLRATPPSKRLTHDPRGLRAAQQAAAGQASAASASPPLAPVVAQVNQPGLGAADEGGALTPPDTTGAIGPNHYVEFVNSLVGVYDRTLAQVASLDLAFFTGFAGASVFDPQILFDGRSGRWYYVADVGMSALAMGWSKTADPSDLFNGWCQFTSFNTEPIFHDYPKLGGDDNFLTIGTNGYHTPDFTTSVSSFIWATVKPAPGDTSCAVPNGFLFGSPTSPLTNADGSQSFTPVPANSTDANATGSIVAAHADPFPANKVMAWHLVRLADGSASLFADGDMTVNAFAVPPAAPQTGSTFLIDTNDTRMTQAVGRFDPDVGAQAVWTQHTVAGPGGRSVVRWYEFLPASLTVRQQGEIQNATDFVFAGGISPSSAGKDAAIFYNRSSASTLPLLGSQGRTSATPLSTMDAAELVLGTSVDSLQETGFGNTCVVDPCRWGDYAGATPDPMLPGTVWGTGELTGAYNGGLGQWLSRNYAVTT